MKATLRTLVVLTVMLCTFTAMAASSTASRVLIVGGGTHHDFDRWFNKADVAILSAAGFAAEYTDNPEAIAGKLLTTDVLVLTGNKPIPDPATRKAIFDFVDAGKGVVLLHAGLWYNWNDWREYNRVLCGGGSRGHDALGEFEVAVTEAKHPIMEGVPAKFAIRDELYWFETDAQATPIKVLATAHSKQKNKPYPQVFTIEHAKARVVGITLGHDGSAHELAAFKKLLENAVRWASKTGAAAR